MGKPDWCPQDVWDAGMTVAVEMEVHSAVSSRTDVKADVIARAIIAAKEAACQEALAVVSEFIWDDHALEQATDIGRACHHQAVEIAAAIRQRGETP